MFNISLVFVRNVFYGNNYNMIQDTVANVQAKVDQLTDAEKARVEDQLRGWLYVELYI